MKLTLKKEDITFSNSSFCDLVSLSSLRFYAVLFVLNPKYKLQSMQIGCYLMAKTVRVTEKMSEQYTVLVGQETAEKLEKQTYSDAIKYLLDHHVVFPSELISHIEELIKCARATISRMM